VLERQVLQLTRLVDDLLDVSRITRGKIRLKKETLELGAIVDQALESSQPLLSMRRHKLSLVRAAEPVQIEGDRARLVQIIGNLLNNAAKYTPEGGHIEVQVETDSRQAVVRIRDNGVGISPDLLPHVFEPFRQADETLARSQGGLGVGLTLVQRLIELHGGRVCAHSEGIGRGAVFAVTLPRLEETA
jgi:signal transduction histidine kinase